LRLSYVNLGTVYEKLRMLKVQLCLAGVTLLIAYLLFSILSLYQGQTLREAWALLANRPGFLASQAILTLTLFPLEMRWLVRGRMPSFFIKAASVSGVGFGVLEAFLLSGAFLHFDPQLRLFLVLPIVIPIAIGFYGAVYVMAIKMFEAALWLLVKVLWQIVEYPKGAWSALLFLTTAVLGIVQAAVAAKH
jgi:hypothetical protein